jgi:serine/threonine protein kinase
MPSSQTWEGLENLPEYNNILQMGRERKYPAVSELKNAVKFGGGRSGIALYDLIARMLDYDPETRITAKDALEHEYFKDIVSIIGTLLVSALFHSDIEILGTRTSRLGV